MSDDRAHRQAAATLLRRVLAAVERGELTASTPQGRALLRRIEGAVSALDVLHDQGGEEPKDRS